ncbi:MAG: hypothetical protein ACLUOF_05200 [Ruminococcus sp.]
MRRKGTVLETGRFAGRGYDHSGRQYSNTMPSDIYEKILAYLDGRQIRR